jgi:4-amino-4-deoxy-L-arabinose transferase-like glycosyltransferase
MTPLRRSRPSRVGRQASRVGTAEQVARTRSASWVVVPSILFSAGVHAWGIQRDLPLPQVDERYFVPTAVYMAANGDPDPHWFGHPGSTVLYPLAFVYRIWDLLAHGGPLLGRAPLLALRFANAPTGFYVVGRVWVMTFSLAALPLIYSLGRRVFDARVAGFATVSWTLVPIAVDYGRVVRTDSVALFFALLCLWACVRAIEEPRMCWFVLAGVGAGLGIASRYFLLALVLVIVLAWRVSGAERPAMLRCGILALGSTFVFSTPFLFLDPAAALRSIGGETGSPDPGRGGNVFGNLAYYFAHAIPAAVSWPGLASAVVGMVLTARMATPKKLLLVSWTLVFMAEISLLPFHWDRWLIPVLPIVLLFAVDGLSRCVRLLQGLLRRPRWRADFASALLLGVLVTVMAAEPAAALVRLERTESRRSTRALVQSWIERHVAEGTGVAVEVQGPVLSMTRYRTVEHHILANAGSVADYAAGGYRYLVLNASLDRAYWQRARRYPRAAAFHRDVRTFLRAVADFPPSRRHPGPHLAIYDTATRVPVRSAVALDDGGRQRGGPSRRSRIGSTGEPIPVVENRLLRLERLGGRSSTAHRNRHRRRPGSTGAPTPVPHMS